MMIYRDMDDEELLSLLFMEEDRLPWEAVDEFLRREDRMVDRLGVLVSDSISWNQDLPKWWAVVHATYILGAIGTEETVVPLLRALRLSVACDCDWVFTDLPAIFGKVGEPGVDGLEWIAGDWTTDWYTRTVAMECLAAITISRPTEEREVFGVIGAVFTDEDEDWEVRQEAGNILLDFRREDFREALLSFAEEDEALGKEIGDAHHVAFSPEDVGRIFSSGEKDLRHYIRNWLSFYDEEEIGRRQKRWRTEEDERARGVPGWEGEVPSSGGTSQPDAPKIGRNDPCPCGSGKIYRKCCGMVH